MKPQKSSARSPKIRSIIEPEAEVNHHYDGVEIIFDLPGYALDAAEVQVKNRELKLDAPTPLIREGAPVTYQRTFQLLDAVDDQKITVTLEDGVLKVWIPKKSDL